MPKTRYIPTLSSDGQRRRRYSLEAIERLLSMDLVTVERNRKGNIAFAAFRSSTGASQVRTTAHVGTKYSFYERLETGHHAWALTGLPKNEHEDADLFVRSVFRAVPLSCMVRESKPASGQPASTKVVDIRAFRLGKRAAAARPIEFDSERRAA